MPLASAIFAVPALLGWTMRFQGPLNRWTLLATLLAAAGLVVYWYRAQRTLTSTRTLMILTALRLLLIVLLLVALVQPVVQWTHTRKTAGTLWLMLDQSQSMALLDPQASPVERLRWAEALGFLADNVRPAKLDREAAKLAALRAKLPGIEPVGTAPGEPAAEKAKVRGLVEALEAWQGDVDAAVTALEASDAVKKNGANLLATLHTTRSLLAGDLKKARGRSTLNEAADDISWQALLSNLSSAQAALKPLADAADRDFLAAHATDAAVQNALAATARLTREDLVLQLLTHPAEGRKNIRDLVAQNRVKLAVFSDNAQAVTTVPTADFEAILKQTLIPNGQTTNLQAGLQLITEQTAAAEPASVILLSDGRQNVPGDPTETARLLGARGVRIFALAVGSQEVAADAAVEHIDAPEWIYKDDTLRATAVIRLDGLEGVKASVEFRRDGTLIDTQALTAAKNQDVQRLNFSDKTGDVAVHEYEVRIRDVPGETNTQNNRQSFRVATKKDKLAVLLVEDQPRWEFQYLRNFLARDARVKLQSVLLAPARIEGIAPPPPVRASVDNPKIEADVLPHSREELGAFDVIILGDVPPAVLSAEDQQIIAGAVRDKGTTLLVLAGRTHMPAAYAGTPLAELLPVTPGSEWTPEALQRHRLDGFRPALAPEGSASVLGQFGLDNDSNARLWDRVPRWYWHTDYTAAKPSATVLWAITDPDAAGTPDAAASVAAMRRRALLTTSTVGLGRVLFLGADQTWRLRNIAGENVQERFWGQLLRWAVGSDLPAGGRFVRFGSNRPRYTTSDPVVVTVHVLKEDLTPSSGLSFQVTAQAGPEGGGKTTLQATATEAPDAPGYYRATLTGLPAGKAELGLRGAEVEHLLSEAVDPTVSQKTLLVPITPQTNLEQRNANPDRAQLARLAQASGGVMLDGPYADLLVSQIPQIQKTLSEDAQAGFFADPKSRLTHLTHGVFLVLFTLVLTAEWIVRKMSGMV